MHRERHEFGLPVGVGEDFSDVFNDDLDEYVREILDVTPSIGQRLFEGGLRQSGFRIQHDIFRNLFEAWIWCIPMHYGKVKEFVDALFS